MAADIVNDDVYLRNTRSKFSSLGLGNVLVTDSNIEEPLISNPSDESSFKKNGLCKQGHFVLKDYPLISAAILFDELLATSTHLFRIVCYDISSAKAKYVIDDLPAKATLLKFATFHETVILLAGMEDLVIRSWDLRYGEAKPMFSLIGHESPIVSIDSNIMNFHALCSLSNNGQLMSWNLGDGSLLRSASSQDWKKSARFHPTTGSSIGLIARSEVAMLELDNLRPVFFFSGPSGSSEDFHAMEWSDDGKLIGALSVSRVCIWSTETMDLRSIFELPNMSLTTFLIIQSDLESSKMIVGDWNNIYLWDYENYSHCVSPTFAGSVEYILSGSKRKIVTYNSSDNLIQFWSY